VTVPRVERSTELNQEAEGPPLYAFAEIVEMTKDSSTLPNFEK
jgi:hypothetical protein